jgi:hypothetical protein
MTPADRDRIHRAAVVLLIPVFIAILVVPHLSRIRHASIYSDDVQRIADLQTRPLSALWFRPFNEHMAPFYETVSWLTWQVAGRDLTHAPLAFTLASYVPFVLCLGLLAWWVRFETSSLTTALTSTVLFGLSPLYAETVFWYSASGFTWALFWTMIALLGAGSAEGARGRAHRLGLLIGSLLAPACSAVGLLAGPLGTLRLAAGRRDRQRGWFTVVIPTTGTLIYLAVCSAFRYYHVIKSGIYRDSDIAGGLLLALRAPTARLMPGTFGFHDVDLWLPPSLNLALTGLGLIAIIPWATRSPQRGLIAAALGLILGGYALTYPFRNHHGAHWLFQNERFHLFPQLGLVVLIALVARRWLSRFDQRPLAGLVVATGLAVLLLGIHIGRFENLVRTYRFPEQRRTLAALERLGVICRARNVARQQCIAALEPVWTHWFQPEYNGLWMVPAPTQVSGRPDLQVQQILLEQLTATERKALWGGMDISRYLSSTEDLVGASPDCVAVGRLVETDHAHCGQLPLGMGMRQYTMTGWPAYLEFELTPPESSKGAGPSSPRFLCLPCGPSPEPLEIWWAKRGERWSSARCVRFRPDPKQSPREWAFPLDRIPHWDPTDAGRIRIRFVAAPIAIGEPRLLR